MQDVQAATPAPISVDAAVEQTCDIAVQAGPPSHQEGCSSQGVLVLAEQAGLALRADNTIRLISYLIYCTLI